MAKLKKRDTLFLLMMGISVIWGGQIYDAVEAVAQDVYGRFGQADDNRYAVEAAIRRFYVEEVDVEALQQAQIDGMIQNLDIYTGFLERRQQEELRHTTRGEFGGLGIHIQIVDRYPTVITPLEGTPAWEVGLQTGDKITEIEGTGTLDLTINNIVDQLRGTPGTVVNITVRRPGTPDAIPFSITRAVIQIHAVSFQGRVYDPEAQDSFGSDIPGWLTAAGRVGYIRITNFSHGVSGEIATGIRKLRRDGIDGFILDLRNNPGGLLGEARAVSDLFLPQGALIVSTKGRAVVAQRYHADRAAVLPDEIPMVVLINGGSASASEIVAGAIQDSDRGIVLGTTSFGKGSVQTVYDASQGAKYDLNFGRDVGLKLTTAYYYTPSGRSIHKHRMGSGLRKVITSHTLNDSDAAYSTQAGRRVQGGGGISPDVIVKSERPTLLYSALWRKQLFFAWGVDYAAQHEGQDRKSFNVTDEMIDQFREFVSDTSRMPNYSMPGMAELKEFEDAIKDADYGPQIQSDLSDMRRQINERKDMAFDRSREMIRTKLSAEIGGRLWGRGARTRGMFTSDVQLKEATLLLTSSERYASQLAQSPPAP